VAIPNILARKSEESPVLYCKADPNQRVTINWVSLLMAEHCIVGNAGNYIHHR
jgi:hypothetical protein